MYFFQKFFKIKTSEQQIAIDHVNLVYYSTGFVWSHRLHQGFNKMNKIELQLYCKFTVQITFKLGCEQQKKKTPTNRKFYANPAQQIGNVTLIQRNKLSKVYFWAHDLTLNFWKKLTSASLFQIARENHVITC